MRDRNGTPLHPGDWAVWLPNDSEVDPEEVEVMREHPSGKVIVALCIEDHMAAWRGRDILRPATIAAIDQTMARARDEGTPSGCLPLGVPSEQLEKLEDEAED
jgi:hypothetical protein